MFIKPLVSGLVLSAILLLAPITRAQSITDFGAACSSLERPNIDCDCVGERLEMLSNFSELEVVKAVINERYADAIGRKNRLEEALVALNSDQMQAVSVEMSFDKIGGFPSNINEYEAGCVIPNAPTFDFEDIVAGSQAETFVESAVKSAGEGSRRTYICQANLMSAYLSEAEFEAYQLSYSYYASEQNADDKVARAKKMGVSVSEYSRLEKSARGKISDKSAHDNNYCDAMTHADRVSEELNQKHKREQSNYRELLKSAPPEAAIMTGNDETKARNIMQNSCLKTNNSESYCRCVMSDFEAKVVSRSPRPSVTLAWVVMHGGADIRSDTLMQMMMQAKREDQQAAAQLFMSTMDVGDSCVKAKPETELTRLKGDAFSRMIKVCLADVGDETICNCTTNKMRDKMTPDDFELIVDLREAEFQGASDPLAIVAKQRGLSAQQAQEAMLMNQSLMGSVMAMDLMSCVGGMPDMSQF
jgi:hypothetical protein